MTQSQPGPAHSENLWEELQAGHPFPLSVMLSLTGRCNLTCPHCELPACAAAEDELSFDQIETLLDDLAEAGVISLTLTGGEPALRDDLEQIVRAASDRHFLIKLKTNAVLLNAERRQALLDAGLAGLHISLYHPDPEPHDRFVGHRGAWQTAVDALAQFSGEGIESQGSVIVMDWNASSIPRLLDILEARGVSYIVDTHVAPRGDGDDGPCAFRASEQTIQAIISDPRLLEGTLKGPRLPDSRPCQAGRNSAFVNHDGSIWPCARLRLKIGNVLEGGFAEQWLASDVRRELLALRWSDLPECGTCPIARSCSRCPAISLVEGGDIKGRVEFTCSVARAYAAAAKSDRS